MVHPRSLTCFTWKWWFPSSVHLLFQGLILRWSMLNFRGVLVFVQSAGFSSVFSARHWKKTWRMLHPYLGWTVFQTTKGGVDDGWWDFGSHKRCFEDIVLSFEFFLATFFLPKTEKNYSAKSFFGFQFFGGQTVLMENDPFVGLQLASRRCFFEKFINSTAVFT